LTLEQISLVWHTKHSLSHSDATDAPSLKSLWLVVGAVLLSPSKITTFVDVFSFVVCMFMKFDGSIWDCICGTAIGRQWWWLISNCLRLGFVCHSHLSLSFLLLINKFFGLDSWGSPFFSLRIWLHFDRWVSHWAVSLSAGLDKCLKVTGRSSAHC